MEFMFEILKKKVFAADTYLFEVKAPHIAGSALPGQFLIVKMTPEAERIPLTISDYDREKQTITIVFKAIGESTRKMAEMEVGDCFADVAGPLGRPSEMTQLPLQELKKRKYIFMGGGVGIAPIYPQVKWLHEQGVEADCIIGARTKELIIFEEELQSVCHLHTCSDDGSTGYKGVVTDLLRELVKKGNHYDELVAIGPLIMTIDLRCWQSTNISLMFVTFFVSK